MLGHGDLHRKLIYCLKSTTIPNRARVEEALKYFLLIWTPFEFVMIMPLNFFVSFGFWDLYNFWKRSAPTPTWQLACGIKTSLLCTTFAVKDFYVLPYYSLFSTIRKDDEKT
jgi:hypothetical protein